MEHDTIMLTNAVTKFMEKDGNLTPHFQAYLQHEHIYNSKVEARNRAYSAALNNPLQRQLWPIEGAPYQHEVDAAWESWIGLGFKLEIDQALHLLNAQGAHPALALIARAKKKFQDSRRKSASKKSS